MGDSTKKYISIFNDGTNDLYIKDAEAQQAISNLLQSVTGGIHYIGETSTELTDGATTSTLVAKSEGSLSKTTGFVAGDLVIYGELEFIFNGTKWQEFGSTGSLKSLAFKDASDLETAGSTSQKLVTTSITGVSGSTTVTGVDGSTTVTGVDGSTSVYGCGDNATVGSASAWSAGTAPSMTYTENTETLTFSAGTVPSLTITDTDVATKAASATTVPIAAAAATTVPIAAASATNVPTAASSATTVATGSVANDGTGGTVVTSVSTTIQNKPTV